MAVGGKSETLTGSLEDYLETIFELVRDQKVARVRDIAKIRGVRSASVTPAMKRLAEMGLIRYVQREYIDLTPEGEVAARKIYARHQALTRLFVDVLKMPADLAAKDACAMEHSLSGEGLDHLVRFFEFLRVCPGGENFLETFHSCSLVHTDVPLCAHQCGALARKGEQEEEAMSLSSIAPGARARVTQVSGSGAIRQRLLDMGVLPGVLIEVERVAPAGDPLWIKLQGYQISLRHKEAELVKVAVDPVPAKPFGQ